MIHPKGQAKKFKGYLSLLLIIALAMFSSVSCDSIFGTDEPEETTTEGTEANIIVYNDYGETLDIFMDGQFKFILSHGSNQTIEDVSLESHYLEARISNTDTFVSSTTIDVTFKIDYTWSLDDPPDINVTNNYGITLKIYMDNTYQFDLVDEENRWLIDVSTGERFLKAVRASDGQEIASTTIDVNENKDYAWTIQ